MLPIGLLVLRMRSSLPGLHASYATQSRSSSAMSLLTPTANAEVATNVVAETFPANPDATGWCSIAETLYRVRMAFPQDAAVG